MMTISTTVMNTDPGAALLAAARSGDPSKFIDELTTYRNGVRNPETGSQLVGWVSTPSNLTQLHNALAEHMGVPHRAMAIRRLNVTRGQKVMMLLQAMEIAVRRTHKL